MPDRTATVNRLIRRAILPLTKIVREEDKIARTITKNLKGVVQFRIKGTDEGTYLEFENDELEVKEGIHENPTVCLTFANMSAMNDFFMGKIALPVPTLKSLIRLDVLIRALPLLLGLTLLLPTKDPKDPAKKALKVKLTLYMVTVALSQLNKMGDEQMTKLTKKSPDRIYQWVVEGGGPAAFLRMKNGKTKAGKGVYTRRRPFVQMSFPDMDGAYMVLTSKAPLVEAVAQGFVVTEGAMEYSKEIGLRMQYVEELMTP